MSNRAHPDRLVSIGAKVPSELAEAVRDLAESGNRSVSREVRRAVEVHVEKSSSRSSSVAPSDGGDAVPSSEGTR